MEGKMKSEETEKVGRRWFEDMWGMPDLNLADKIVDPSYNPSWIHIDAIGPAQIKHEIKYFRSIFPDLKYEIIDIKGEEDKFGFAIWVGRRIREKDGDLNRQIKWLNMKVLQFYMLIQKER